MTVPRSVFQYTDEYLTLHEPSSTKDCFCYSCEKQFWFEDWVYSNYNGLRLVRRHLLCAYKKNLLTHVSAKELNPSAPSQKVLEETKSAGPVTINILDNMTYTQAIATVLYRENRAIRIHEIADILTKEWKKIDERNISSHLSMKISSNTETLQKYIHKDFLHGVVLTPEGRKWYEETILLMQTQAQPMMPQ